MNTKDKQRYRIHVGYDGYPYNGWQIQPVGKATVQGSIEKALKEIFREPIRIIGSGRTDAGVHAYFQVAHFDAPAIPQGMDFQRVLQDRLPSSIALREAYLAPDDFHAQISAEEKTYKYHIYCAHHPHPLKWGQSLWLKNELNIEYLNEISQLFVGEHDFKSFQNQGTLVNSTIRTILEATWYSRGKNWVIFTIRGTGFLKQMVRNLVGTCLDMEKRASIPSKMKEILEAQSRQAAAKTVGAEGLHLVHVKYPAELDNKCLEL